MDNHSDFSKFSKIEVINSFIDEIVAVSILDKQVEEPAVSIAMKIGTKQNSCRKFVATETDSWFVVTDKSQKQATSEINGSLDILDDEITKKPSYRVRKNHPTDLIKSKLDDVVVTRRRYVNFSKDVYFVSLSEPKKC